MFTQIEKMEQGRLRKAGANLYTIDVTNDSTNETIEVKVFSESDSDALLLARRISKRTERTLLEDLNFDIREIKDNKLGLLLPWKDPVNKRSVNTAIRLPLNRSKNLIVDIMKATKGKNTIHTSELDDVQLSEMKSACMINNFISLILLIVGFYIYFNAAEGQSYSLSVALCFVVSITTYIKTRKSLAIIKIEEISRQHIWTDQ